MAIGRPRQGSALVEVKAVERGYLTVGGIELKDGLSLADALADKDGAGRGRRVRAAR